MAQFVDFVGLNTFIYETVGYIPEALSPEYNGAFYEYVTGDGIAYTTPPPFPPTQVAFGFVMTLRQHIGNYGFSQPNNYWPLGWGLREMYNYIDINQLQNHKFPLHLSASMHGIPSSASYFPALMLKRNGPYGHPMFKQIRVHQNPLTRRQIKENIFTIVETPSQEAIRTFGNNKIETIRSRYGNIVGFREAMVTSRYQPLDWLLGFSSDDERIVNAENPSQENIERLILRNSYGNDINFFANAELDNRLGLEIEEDEDYERISNFYLNGGLDADDSPASTFEFLKYRETVFPRETNAFRAISRKRINYLNNFWRDDRDDRSIIRTDSFGISYGTANSNTGGPTFLPSIWPLDADRDYLTKSRPSSISSITTDYIGARQVDDDTANLPTSFISGGAGILQNQYSTFSHTALTDQIEISYYLNPAPVYNRRHAFGDLLVSPSVNQRVVTGSVVAPDGILIPETGSGFKGAAGVGAPFQGQALWEAGTQAGKNPFYSSYDYWWEQLRLKAKDYSVVPEFRISEFIDTIEKSGSQTFIDNMFEVTGGSSGETDTFDPSAAFFGNDSSETKFYETYSTSDFMKHFAKIKKDHDEFVEPSKITLTCKAFKKFLAYDSFYPANRTVDLATQFSRSYAEFISATSSLPADVTNDSYIHAQKLQNLLVPTFAPGVLYNSIKSGIACDYPIMTGTLPTTITVGIGSVISGSFYSNRIPFESIVNPEKYLSNIDLICNEPSNFANTEINSVWSGQGDNLYKKMANNFVAETINFFLEDSQLSFIASKTQADPSFGNAVSQQSYGMRVKVFKTHDGQKFQFEGENGKYYPPNTYITGGATAAEIISPRENITMYSRPSAFGPPTQGRGGGFNGSYAGHNFPYTPPYYDGEAWCDIIFTAGETRKYTLSEIISEAEFRLIRVDPMSAGSSSIYLDYMTPLVETQFGMQATKFNRTTGDDSTFFVDASTMGLFKESKLNYKFLDSPININAMNINSSINLAGQAVLSEGGLNFTSFTDGDPNARWIIQPKWETPILNFNDVSASVNLNENSLNAQTPRGMWHQYGRIPFEDEGIYLKLENIPNNWNSNFYGLDKTQIHNTGSLIDLCGFDVSKVKLGKIESKKIIKEAVVAVPYIQKANRKQFYSIGEDQVFNAKKFIDIIRKEAIGAPRDGDQLPEFYQDKTTSVIIDMVRKMDEFVFPPTMDFVHFPEKVKPFAMYIFEFSHELNQQDLADIWQNLPPRLGENFEEAEATISHPLFSDHFLSSVQREEGQQTPTGGTIDTEIRWMIFKVKQRAETDYSSKVVSGVSNKTLRKKVLFPKSSQERKENIDSLLSYNWPYDYFSLVELVKLDAEFTFADIDPNNPDALGRKGNPNKDKAKKTIQSRLKQPAPLAPPASEAPSTLPPTANNSEASQPNQGQPGPGMGMQTQTARFKAAQIAGVFPKPGGN